MRKKKLMKMVTTLTMINVDDDVADRSGDNYRTPKLQTLLPQLGSPFDFGTLKSPCAYSRRPRNPKPLN